MYKLQEEDTYLFIWEGFSLKVKGVESWLIRKRWPVGRGEEWICKRAFQRETRMCQNMGPWENVVSRRWQSSNDIKQKMQVEIKYSFKKFKASKYVKIIVAATESLPQILKRTILKLNVYKYK